jgi:hypothetical protein
MKKLRRLGNYDELMDFYDGMHTLSIPVYELINTPDDLNSGIVSKYVAELREYIEKYGDSSVIAIATGLHIAVEDGSYSSARELAENAKRIVKLIDEELDPRIVAAKERKAKFEMYEREEAGKVVAKYKDFSVHKDGIIQFRDKQKRFKPDTMPYNLAVLLARAKGKVVKRDKIVDTLWPPKEASLNHPFLDNRENNSTVINHHIGNVVSKINSGIADGKVKPIRNAKRGNTSYKLVL